MMNRKPQLSPLALVVCIAFAPAALRAADATMDAVIVSATRNPTPLENAPGQVEVVTAADIAKNNDGRINDSLKRLPGVFVQTGRGGMQPNQAMSLRGIPDDRRIQILLDGVPLNDGLSGSANFGGMAPEAIDRVEVLYGPASSLYGGNAMGGVVSYTTRMPTATEVSLRTGFGDPFASGKGLDNLRRTSLSAGTKLSNDLQVLAGGHWMSTDGYRSEATVTTATSTAPAANITGWSRSSLNTGAPAYIVGDKGRTAWDEDSAFLKLQQRLANGDQWRLGWQRQRYDYESVDPRTYLRSTASGAPVWNCCGNITQLSYLKGASAFERNLYHAGYDTELLDGLLKISVAYADLGKNWNVTPTAANATPAGGAGRISDSLSQSRMVDAFWNRQYGSHGLTLGAAWHRDRGRNEEFTLRDWRDPSSVSGFYARAGGETTTTGLYVQDEWQLNSTLLSHLGLRYDHWRSSDGSISTPGWTSGKIFRDYAARSEGALSPKLALAWKVDPAVTLRSSLGSAFRAPSVYELYRSGKIGTTTYQANPDLKPETVRTLDFGADVRPWEGGEIKATLFANRMRDLIYTEGGPSGGTKRRINVDRAESSGVVMSFSQRLGIATRLFGSFTYTDSAIRKNPLNAATRATEGKDLTFLPRRQATLGADTHVGDWTLAANARYASKQFSADDNSDVASGVQGVYDAYVVADAKVSYRIDRNFTAALSVDNLFDRDYFSFYAAPRRSWFAELSYKY